MERPVIDIRVGDAPVLRVWEDGRIVWSEDQVNGGPPLHQARIEPGVVAQALADIDVQERAGPGWTDDAWSGPDAQCTSLVIRSGERDVIKLASWHEQFEADPRLVVTASGVQPLGERRRVDVLESQPAEYIRFRHRWDSLRERLRRLIPTA